MDLEVFQDPDKQKTLDRELAMNMVNEWLKGFEFHQPSDLFEEFPNFDPNLQSIIQSPLEFFLETLQFYGLP